MARQLGIQFVEDRLQRRSNGSWREGEARDTSSAARDQPITYLQLCTHHNTMAMQVTVVIE